MVLAGMTNDPPGSWQDRLLEASFITVRNEYSRLQKTDDAIELFGAIDNTSSQCSGIVDGVCVPCSDDKPLWWLVLRWLKVMIYKVATMYIGRPLFLMIFPLLVGLVIGYLVGRTQSQQSRRLNSANAKSSTLVGLMIWLRDGISMLFLQFFARNSIDEVDLGKSQIYVLPSSMQQSGIQEENTQKGLVREDLDLVSREERTRANLKSDEGTVRESGVDPSQIPQHVAVIMDGNRRYGKEKYGDATRGHWDGSSKLVDFAKWCIAEQISVLTVYAFSTENWNRPPDEVAALMSIFSRYCDELRVEALKRNIKILVLSTERAKIPSQVQQRMTRMVAETDKCTGLTMNICMSYGGRSEIVAASRSLVADSIRGELGTGDINEGEFHKRLLTSHCGDPDVLIRTSGEIRISNFLLWQLAYTEMFFVDKPWPAVDKADLLQVIRTFAKGRRRRFGR